MVFPRFEFSGPPPQSIARIQQNITRAPAILPIALKRTNAAFVRRVLPKLRDEPGSPVYPIRWKSAKQRRFVMRKLRMENNLPYQRTGTLSSGWRADYPDGRGFAAVVIYNMTPYARFVQGDDAQPFHLNTGWVQAATVVNVEFERYEDAVFETYVTVYDPFAGVQA